jgi:hypothetical protein
MLDKQSLRYPYMSPENPADARIQPSPDTHIREPTALMRIRFYTTIPAALLFKRNIRLRG